jgi:hypothetical protein
MAKRLAGLSNSQDITRTVGSIFGSPNAVEQMRELVGKLKGSPEALDGLKKAVADHIATLATGTTEAGASGVNKVNASPFQKFVARNEAVLKAAGFSEAQISNMRALANDLQRSQRTMQATALPATRCAIAGVTRCASCTRQKLKWATNNPTAARWYHSLSANSVMPLMKSRKALCSVLNWS